MILLDSLLFVMEQGDGIKKICDTILARVRGLWGEGVYFKKVPQGPALTLSRHGVDTTFPHNALCIQNVSKLNTPSKQVIA
jgi:hypothetical protein